MNYATYQRLVIAYHGCDTRVARDVLDRNQALSPSENDYDWLGHGIYFWEHGPARALEWAEQQKMLGKIKNPAVVGVILHLGNCFDFLDTHFTDLLGSVFPAFELYMQSSNQVMPVNSPVYPGDSENLLRRLDCAVINWTLGLVELTYGRFQSVRGVFQEGDLAFPNSAIRRKSHIQIAVRDPACIVGYFRPT